MGKRDENENAEVGIEQAEFDKGDRNKKAELDKTDTNEAHSMRKQIEEHDKRNNIGAFYLETVEPEEKRRIL